MNYLLIFKEIVIVIVVRDRFSMFKPCLEAIYLHTTLPFRVLVVIGGADNQTKAYLNNIQEQKDNFKVIFTDQLLMQGESRNIAFKHFNERYCIILENDTIVHENWLAPLLKCMHEEKAAVVTPLIYWHRGVHSTGGRFVEYEKDGMTMFKNQILYTEIKRKRIDYPENHCLLIDRHQFPAVEIFDDVEPFDVDLGLILRQNGLIAFFEPLSVVTYSAPPHCEERDLIPFYFRWNAQTWEERNKIFMRKWNLNYDPAHKIASYKRQQLKLEIARRFPNKLTLGISNNLIRLLNFIHMMIFQISYLKRKIS